MAKVFDKLKGKKWLKRLIIILVILVILVVGVRFAVQKAASAFLNRDAEEISYEVGTVERRTIENYLSSSGTVQALDTYSVTTVSTVEGTVLTADFEEGDLVEEGQVLYQISTDSLDSRIESAEKSVTRAEENYQEALENYEEAKEELGDLLIRSEITGYVKSVEVEAGDSVQSGSSRLVQIYNNKTMLLELPFLASEVSSELVGSEALVEMSETGEELEGVVTKVSPLDEVLTGGRIVRYVTIEVENPGAIVEGSSASAVIEDTEEIFSSEEGSFAVSENDHVVASVSGEISQIYVQEGDWVEAGDPIAQISGDSASDQLESLLDKVESAEESLENARDSLQDVYDTKADYTITSPITGTVIRKNTKAGDTLSATSMNSTLCLIYDLSAMTFEMYVDELDVMSVEAGQTVNITADALEGETFTGVITNVSLVSSTSGGVTQYPVTVRIDETGDLLPGMNISGEIVIESAENVLTVPVNALQRGNLVYVEDPSVTEATGDVPAGFRAVEVVTGISNDEYIEIRSGLEEGDSIYIPGRSSNSMSGMFPGMSGMPGGDFEMPSGGGSFDMPGGGDSGGGRGGNSGGGFPGGGF